MQYLFDVLKSLYDLVQSFFVWALGVIDKLITALVDLLQDFAIWIFESILSLVISVLSALDLTGITQQVGSFAGLPEVVLNMMGLLGFGTCAGIIVSAIGIRILLQLIPFTRLGS